MLGFLCYTSFSAVGQGIQRDKEIPKPRSGSCGASYGIHTRYNDRGEVAEWSIAAVLKTADGATRPWVRIPPSPPFGTIRFH